MKFKIWSVVAFAAMIGAGLHAAPTVSGVTRSILNPKPSDAITLSANITGATSVKLFVDSSYNSTTGAGTPAFTESLMDNSGGGNTWTFTLPASSFADKTYIKWYVEASDASGTTRFPSGTGTNVFSVNNSPTTANEIVITEIIADPAGGDNGSGAGDYPEWFEIYNKSSEEIDLSYFKAGNYVTGPNSRTIAQGTKISSHGFKIFAGNKQKFLQAYPTVDPNIVYDMAWTVAVLPNNGGATNNAFVASANDINWNGSTAPFMLIPYELGVGSWPTWASPNSNSVSFQLLEAGLDPVDGYNWSMMSGASPGAHNESISYAGLVTLDPLPNTPIPFKANITPGATSAKLYYDVNNSGTFTAINMTAPSGSGIVWTATVPGQSNNSIVKYYVEATFPSGAKVYPAAPTNPLIFQVLANPYQASDIVVNEIMWNPAGSDNGIHVEWVELYNKSTKSINLSETSFRRYSTEGYPVSTYLFSFPSNTIIPANGYVVLAGLKSNFLSIYNDVDPDIVYDLAWPAGTSVFSNSNATPLYPEFIQPHGDSRDLKTSKGSYHNAAPWPMDKNSSNQSPNNEGPSIELINPNLDGTQGHNWKTAEGNLYSSAMRGTPGQQNSTYVSNVALQVYDVQRSVQYPKATDNITISAKVSSTGNITSAKVYVDSGSGTFTPITMTGTMAGPLSGAAFTASIGSFADKTYVKYYVEVSDNNSNTVLAPEEGAIAPNIFLVENVISAPAGSLVINEIQFDPAGGDNKDSSEWVEIYNPTNSTIDLSYFVFSPQSTASSNKAILPLGTTIPAKGFVIIAGNKTLFEEEYLNSPFTFTPNQVVDTGRVVSTMSNGSNTISLRHVNAWGYSGTAGNPLDTVSYTPGNNPPVANGWPGTGTASPANAANNTGNSLELKAPTLDNNVGSNWVVSAIVKGTPGQVNEIFKPVNMIINRDVVYPNSTQTFKMIVTATAANSAQTVSGVSVFISTNGTTFTEYPLTSVGSDQWESAPVGPYADGTVLSFYAVGTSSAGESVAFPKYYVEPHYNLIVGNGMPKVFPNDVVINEILYDNIGSDQYEWVELYNRTSNPVDLKFYRFGDNQNNYYVFPADASSVIAPNGYMIVTMSAAAFSNGYTPSVPVHDWNNRFNLANTGDTIRLVHPNEYRLNGLITSISEVQYKVVDPWPTWVGAPAQTSGAGPNVDGRTIELINPNFADYGTNGARWGWTVGDNGMLYGTPGAQNSIYSTASVSDWTIY